MSYLKNCWKAYSKIFDFVAILFMVYESIWNNNPVATYLVWICVAVGVTSGLVYTLIKEKL